MKQRLLLILFACCYSISAMAEFVKDTEIYIGTADYFHDEDNEFKDAFSAEFGFELPVDNDGGDFSWDIWFSRFNLKEKDNSAKRKAKSLYQGFLYHLTDGNVRSFVSAGVGHRVIDGGGDEDVDVLFTLGVGFKKYFKSNYIFRSELFAQDNGDVAARLTVGYVFGQKYVRVPFEREPEPEPEPEPIPEPEPEPIPEPEPAPVDSDLDGVVDETGCPVMLPEKVTMSMDIKFLINSAELELESFAEIRKLADFLKQFDGTSVVVEGHTDSLGRSKYNLNLSQKRAETVMNTLVEEYDISLERLDAQGYGEDKPIADNATELGRATNRRVVVVVESTMLKSARK